jgi:hypothetical protein
MTVEIDQAAIRRFAPDGLLTIQLSSIQYEGRRLPDVWHVRGLTYNLEFTLVSKARTVWKGRISNSGYGQVGAGWKEMGAKTTSEIVDRLIQDKIIYRRPSAQPGPVG